MDGIGIAKPYSKVEPGSIRKVLALLASPRKQGVSKTEMLLEAFLQGCRDEGAGTETVYLRRKKINHCTGCYTCWTKTPGICIFQDDVREIIDKETAADLSVYAFPLYHFGMPALLKKYIERTLPVAEPFLLKRADGTTTHPIREAYGSKHYLVVLGVCGFPEVSHFGAVSTHFHCLAAASGDQGIRIVSEIYRPASETLGVSLYRLENQRVFQHAREAGAQVVRDGSIDQRIVDSIARVEMDIEGFRKVANQAWAYCIKEGISLPEFQRKMADEYEKAK